MSRRPIAHSPDLQKLQNEGYDLDIRGGCLLVACPYVDSRGIVQRDGILISKLELSGDITNKPTDHQCYWTGEHPCHSDGSLITAFRHGSNRTEFGEDVVADHSFSAKADYRDYHHKITTYVGRINGEAVKLDPSADARSFPVIAAEVDDGPFNYIDTASSRAGIGAVNVTIAGLRIGIAGLGGTGSYILDLMAKTSVAEIHIFDADVFSQHNAFRSPGAPSVEELQKKPKKVARFAELYSRMRRGIFPHDVFLDVGNVQLLDSLDFVFVCMDVGPAKRAVVGHLVANKVSFIEVGMGVNLHDGQLGGIVRSTMSTPETWDRAAPHISFAEGAEWGNEYASNIQIAELNAINAAIAVVRWKKYYGIYRDSRQQVYAGYSIATGEIVSEGIG